MGVYANFLDDLLLKGYSKKDIKEIEGLVYRVVNTFDDFTTEEWNVFCFEKKVGTMQYIITVSFESDFDSVKNFELVYESGTYNGTQLSGYSFEFK